MTCAEGKEEMNTAATTESGSCRPGDISAVRFLALCCLLPMVTFSLTAGELDSLLMPVCESKNQIFTTREKRKFGTYSFRHTYMDSTYKHREIFRILSQQPASARHMKNRATVFWVGLSLCVAGITMQIVDFAGGDYDFFSPLNLAGNVAMYAGLGIGAGSTRHFKLAVHSFNSARCNERNGGMN